MPGDDGVRSNDGECGSPIGPDATEPDPEEPISGGQLGPLHGTLPDTELVTKRQDLELKGRAAAE